MLRKYTKATLLIVLIIVIFTSASCTKSNNNTSKSLDKTNTAITANATSSGKPVRSYIPQVIDELIIDNPYDSIAWDKVSQYKSNFHTHTTNSDGSEAPQKVVDYYANKGFKILAITDHNYYNTEGLETLPWNELSGITDTHNLIAIAGCEVASSQDMNSLFSRKNYMSPIATIEDAALIGQNENAVLSINHPGRYETSVETYIELYKKFPALISMEILNGQNMGTGDPVKTYDSVLSSLMPKRTVWASGGDDYHYGDPAEKVGKYFNIMLLNEENLNRVNIEKAYRRGQYFVGATFDASKYQLPVVKSIAINQVSDKIEITVEGCKKITWVSGDASETVVIEGNNKFNLDVKKLASEGKISKYVRFVFENDEGQVYSQPFGIFTN